MNTLPLVFCTMAICAAIRGSGLTMLLSIGAALLISLYQNWSTSKWFEQMAKRKAQR